MFARNIYKLIFRQKVCLAGRRRVFLYRHCERHRYIKRFLRFVGLCTAVFYVFNVIFNYNVFVSQKRFKNGIHNYTYYKNNKLN